MIYRINDLGKPERLTPAQIAEYREKLKEVFPRSFRDNNPEPVRLHYSKQYMRKVTRFDNKFNVNPTGREIRKMPALTVLKTVERVNEGGFSRTYMYSEAPLVIKDNGEVQGGRGISIRPPGINLDPVMALEKIIFLYFFSSQVGDSGRGENRNAYTRFARPDIAAKENIAKITLNVDIHNTFLNEQTRISYDDLRKISSAMQIALNSDENEDRLTMYSRCQDATVWERFKRVSQEVISQKNTSDLSEINEKVKKAKSKEINVVRKKDGKWILTTTGGEHVRDIVEVNGSNANDQHLNLVDYLKGDPDTVQKMNELVAAAEQFV